ncbi:fibronectin type III domain-containing protein [Capnocytophaga bilenii]
MKKVSFKHVAHKLIPLWFEHWQILKLANWLIFLLIFIGCSKSNNDEPEAPATVQTPEHLTDWSPKPKIDVAQPYMAFATGNVSATTLSITAVGSTATATDVWVDTNNNGVFDEGIDKRITDFTKPITFTATKGLFTVYGKVKELNATGNALTAADVRKNEALTKLNIADNWLEEKALLDLVKSLPTATGTTEVVLHRAEGDGNAVTDAVLIAAKQRGWQTLKIKDNKETPDLPADTKAPKAGAITEATAIAFNTLSLKWTAATDDKTATGKLRYQVLYNVKGSSEVKTSEVKENMLVLILTGLTEKTTYIVKVKVMDEANNATDYEAKEVTTPAAPEAADKEAPKAGAISEATATFNTLNLKWTPATDNKTVAEKLRYQVLYNVKGSSEVKTSELKENMLALSLTGLTEKTTYVVKVKVMDEAGNTAEYQAKEVTTPAEPDTQAPTPAAISDRITVTDQTATLSWEAATDNKTSFEGLRYQVFWKANGSGEVKNSGTPKAAFFSYKIEGLTPSTTYIVWVEVFDKAGNKAKYPEKTFTTAKKEEPKPEPKDTHYIELTTDKAVGEKIELDIYAFDEYKAGVWVDLNGNGKWDEGIDEKPTEFNRKIKYTLQAQRIRIYGIVRNMKCPKNQLTEVDISHTPALTRLYAAENNLPSIAHLEDIEELSIDSHTLLASSLPEGLTELIVRETTPLTTINTSLFTELRILDIDNCKNLKSLDLSKNEKLTNLSVYNTGLTTLDLSNQPNLRILYADFTPLTKLNVAGNRALEYVRIQLTKEGKGLQGEALMNFLRQLPTKEAGKEGSIYLSPAQATEGVKGYLRSKFWSVN